MSETTMEYAKRSLLGPSDTGRDFTSRCDYCDKRGVREYPNGACEPYLACDECAERDGLR